MKKRKGLLIGLGIFLLIVVWAIIRISGKFTPPAEVSTITAYSVQTEKVTRGNIAGEIFYTGTVEGINEASVVSQTAGTIEKVMMAVGKKCAQDEVLVVIQNEQQKAGVEQAKSQVMLAETNHEKAVKDLQRTEKLFNEGVATKDNLELSQLNEKAALAQLKGAQAALKVAEKQLSDTYIKSTIHGKIASKDVDLGAMVTPGTKIATIVDDSKVKVKILVAENDIVRLKQNQVVTVKVDALPDKVFQGTVLNIGLTTDKIGRSYPVEVVISNKEDGEIKSGMFARCEIVTEKKDNVLTIPEKAAIINNDGSTTVFIAENGKSILKKVVLGIKGDGKYEVISGLNEGEKVITAGKERVLDKADIIEK
jgi:membrane fusion protein, multidrug efflux system